MVFEPTDNIWLKYGYPLKETCKIASYQFPCPPLDYAQTESECFIFAQIYTVFWWFCCAQQFNHMHGYSALSLVLNGNLILRQPYANSWCHLL